MSQFVGIIPTSIIAVLYIIVQEAQKKNKKFFIYIRYMDVEL